MVRRDSQREGEARCPVPGLNTRRPLTRLYDGALSFQELKRHGNFGLGTFDALDGERVALDWHFFQIRADGRAVRVDEKILTPFAAVTDFDPDLHISIHQPTTFAQLGGLIDQVLPSKNLFYAIKVRGRFIEMTVQCCPPVEALHTRPGSAKPDLQLQPREWNAGRIPLPGLR